ncbi:MAG: hypothetical protein JXA54_08000 [Candidatus Heimdallarchaeota archaeon]|nr:hypothetical protein [Candidatus Heimdallarchaeota archaeon]
MILKKLIRSKKGVSSIISTLLITSIMITSIALTYVYIIPTLDRGRMNSTLSTSALFLTKMDGSIQSLLEDGIGAARTIEVDAFAGNLEFRSLGLNFRAYINGAMYIPIPSIEYGVVRIDIPSDIAVMHQNSINYLKGSPYDSAAITNEGTIDPAVITMERPQTDVYHLQLWYRLILLIRDTGVGGTIDVSLVVIQFTDAESIRGLNSGTYYMTVNKTSVDVNPEAYGFNINGDPITASGSDFTLYINRGIGLESIYTSTGIRTNVSFNLVLITFDFNTIKLN